MKRFVKSPFFPFAMIVFFYAAVLLWGLSDVVGDEMGYSLLCFYIFAPVVELLCGFSAGKRRVWYKWLFPLTGLLNWLIPFVVFGGKFIKAQLISMTFIAAVPALFGLLAGLFYGKRRRTKEIDKMSAQDLR